MVKLIVCVKRNPDMDVEEFHQYCRTSHGELIKSIPGLRKYVRKYIQSRTAPQAYERNDTPCDAVAELWCDDMDVVDGFLADPDYVAKVRPDELKFKTTPTWLGL